jgi:hypothetical protein
VSPALEPFIQVPYKTLSFIATSLSQPEKNVAPANNTEKKNILYISFFVAILYHLPAVGKGSKADDY